MWQFGPLRPDPVPEQRPLWHFWRPWVKKYCNDLWCSPATTRLIALPMSQIASTRKKILCIEDDRETAALIAEELVERRYDVQLAYDGREGIAAILRSMPDLVLSDISMPVMSGFELLERLTTLAPRFASMPFLFLTALTDHDNQLKGR